MTCRDIMTVRLGQEVIRHPQGDHLRLHVEPETGAPFHLAVDLRADSVTATRQWAHVALRQAGLLPERVVLRVPEEDWRIYPGYTLGETAPRSAQDEDLEDELFTPG